MRTARFVVAMTLMAGCSGGDAVLADLHLQPPPANALQIIAPPIRGIASGSDTNWCTWTSFVADRDLFVKGVQGFQTHGGHHVVVYKTKAKKEPGTTRTCDELDLSTFRFVAGAGGEGIQETNEAPGELAFVLEAGDQVVLEQHYINASPKTIDVQSAVTLHLGEPGKSYVRSGAMAFLDSVFTLPRGEARVDVSCTMQRDVEAWFLIPHMHRWGTKITVDHVASVTEATTRLFDTAWEPAFTFQPPEKRYDTAAPYRFKRGDKVNVSCNWLNDTDGELTFGREMCVFYAQTIDREGLGNVSCDRGQWGDF